MKILNVIKLVINSMSVKLMNFFATIIVMVICISLFGFTVFFYQSSRYNRISCQNLFTEGMENTGIIRLESDDSSEAKSDLCIKISKLPTVKNTADFINMGTKIGDLLDIQQTHQEEYLYSADGTLEVTFIDPKMFQICNVKLQSGILPDSYKGHNNEIGIYLGDAYRKSVKLNQCFNSGGMVYRVLGFLRAHQSWPSQILQSFRVSELSNVVDTDYKVFFLKNYDSISGSILLFNISDDTTFDRVRMQIQNMAKESNIGISIASIDGMIRAKEIENQVSMENVKRLFYLILFVSLIMICCQQIVLYIGNSREYGILYSVGMSNFEISRLLVIENLIKTVLSFALSIGVVYLRTMMMHKDTGNYDWLNNILNTLLYRGAFPYMSLMALVVFLVVTSVPLQVFKRMSPVELVRGK